MIVLHRADWVLPIVAAPIAGGWVAVQDGQIVAIGDRSAAPPSGSIEIPPSGGPRVILPGLVNAHVHLELSWMRGQVLPGDSMPAWALRLMALRRSVVTDAVQPIEAAITDIRARGTALVGDITNTLAAVAPLLASPLSATVFREVLGFRVADPAELLSTTQRQLDALPTNARVRLHIAPHAPYSVSPQLLRGIATHDSAAPLSIHLGESREEVEFLEKGGGPWRLVLESAGAWNPDWTAPRRTPVEYLAELGLLGPRLIAVHGVQLTDVDLAALGDAGATLVTCPRSNRWTGAGDPPVERFYESGVRVAIGTDSLASVETLDMFDEMAAVRRLAPKVPAGRILRSATLDGALALGFGRELGSIEPGKRAELVAVGLPSAEEDVEQYLVGPAPKPSVRWLDPAGRPPA